VTMRTFDVGGDKIPLEILSSRGYVHEDNPFLGWRAIRIGLECRDFFEPQLRAILRISASFHVEIMLPMIVSLDEIRLSKKIIEQCKKELKQEKIPFNDAIKVGVMVETPAAAMMADELAKEVDFFSIGTNDLVQYTLAADRGNPKVAPLYSCFHPAVLRLIHHTIESAHKHGIPVAMCGEMASNPYAIILLLGMGLDEFSALPPMLPKIKKLIRSIQFNEAKKFAEKILMMNNTIEIEKAVAEETKKILGVT
ncbi:phosphoenolpyruvate--protein phosphotransferase, partial [bacterium]|nr:phosphoenolpyruvate--protein phosphotransferase [bacterium]